MGKCVGSWVEEWVGIGKCVRVWGPNTLPTFPHISLTFPYHLPLPFPHPNTLSYTSSYTSSHISPSSPYTPTHFSTIPTSLPSRSQSVSKLLCDKVSVAKLLATTKLTVNVNKISGSKTLECSFFFSKTTLSEEIYCRFQKESNCKLFILVHCY